MPKWWSRLAGGPRLALVVAFLLALSAMAYGATQKPLRIGQGGTAAVPSATGSTSTTGSGSQTPSASTSATTAAPTPSLSPTAAAKPTSTAGSGAPAARTAPPTPPPSHAPAPPPPPASHPHVMVIIEENHEYGDIIGNSQAPYINSLANTYGTATNWTAVSHPSLPNYLALTSGSTQGITDDGTGYVLNADNLAHQLAAAGHSWKAYMEDLPSPCSNVDGAGNYAKKHDPFMYYADILNSPAQCNNVVPYPQLATDLGEHVAPDFIWVTPNLQNDMHDGSIAQGDAWLQSQLPTVLGSTWFAAGGTVVITWDEGSSGQGGGGHVATIVITKGKGHAVVATGGNHYGLLRTIEEWYSLPLLGNAGNAGNGDLRGLF